MRSTFHESSVWPYCDPRYFRHFLIGYLIALDWMSPSGQQNSPQNTPPTLAFNNRNHVTDKMVNWWNFNHCGCQITCKGQGWQWHHRTDEFIFLKWLGKGYKGMREKLRYTFKKVVILYLWSRSWIFALCVKCISSLKS